MRVSGARKQLLRLTLLVSALVFVLVPAAAFAQTGGGSGEYPTTPTTPTTQVQATVATKPVNSAGTSTSMPFTGGTAALLTVLGLGAVASGGAILLIRRRRSSNASS
jgi:LPXTG-motif cell wall-anchored protein